MKKSKTPPNLHSQLVTVLIAAVILTTLAAGVPAYAFISSELEQQAWDHVQEDALIAYDMLVTERERLVDLVTLASQRPTLLHLLEAGNLRDLEAYLGSFQAGADLDLLALLTSSGRIISANELPAPIPVGLFQSESGYTVLEVQEQLPILVSARTVHSSTSSDILGYVLAGIWVDENLAQRLTAQSGSFYSFIFDSSRIVSSLPSFSLDETIFNLNPIPPRGQYFQRHVTLDSKRFYSVYVPLEPSTSELQPYLEVALPVQNLVDAERRALLTLTISTICVIAAGSILAGVFSVRIVTPLGQLTAAAKKLSKGDYDSPVTAQTASIETLTLAQAFEESRKNIRNALENLSRAQAWSQTLIQSITEGIVTYDSNNRITTFSQGAERILGWSSEEVLGRIIEDVIPLVECTWGFSKHLPHNGGKCHVSTTNREGQQVEINLARAQFLPPDSADEQSVLVISDITEEQALQCLRSYLLANITHEFRTPLSAINASMELMLEEIGRLSTAEISELLNSVYMSVSGLQTLIDNLLESMSIEAGCFRIHRRKVDFEGVLLEAIHVMKPLLNRRQQQLDISKPVLLPAIHADPTRLSQVLVNLLSNASKFSTIGETIDVEIDSINDTLLRVSVADRGEGVPPEEHSRIFQRFVRLGNGDRSQYGIGIGLSVVKAIVEEHGGEVGINDRQGGGSIFWFTLPVDGKIK